MPKLTYYTDTLSWLKEIYSLLLKLHPFHVKFSINLTSILLFSDWKLRYHMENTVKIEFKLWFVLPIEYAFSVHLIV